MVSLEDVIGQARPPEASVALCLRGDLAGRHEELVRQLGQSRDAGDWVPDTLSDANPNVELAGQIRDLEAEMAEHQTVFRFRGVGQHAWRELVRAHPARTGVHPPETNFNADTFPAALIAASLYDPQVASVQQVERLLSVLTQGQLDQLVITAFAVNTGSGEIPKSELALATIRATAPN